MQSHTRALWGIALACFLLLASGKAFSADILLGYGSHFDEPYAVVEDGELVDGWVLMTAEALSNVMETPVSPVAIPRKRSSVMISEGDLDLYCFTNPTWAKEMKSVAWSEQLFDVSNMVIAKNRVAKAIRSQYDLRGFYIGTIFGYNYHSLTPFFDHGQIQRVDTKSFEQNLKMLKNERVEAAIIPDTVAENMLVRLGMEEDYSAAPYMVSKRSLHCAVSTSNRYNHDRLIEAINELKKNGVFEWPELAERY